MVLPSAVILALGLFISVLIAQNAGEISVAVEELRRVKEDEGVGQCRGLCSNQGGALDVTRERMSGKDGFARAMQIFY